jgi:radical SAM/Cys-rich protein
MRVPLTIRHDPIAPGAFSRRVALAIGGPLKALSIRAVQLNIGLQCNLSCRHCHVSSSPRRKEEMSWETMKLALTAAQKVKAAVIDITGGEPETHPRFRKLIETARAAELQVIVRTNLVILLQKPYRALPEFFKKHCVRLIASFPSFIEANVDRQRGEGVYRQSIDAIKLLNGIGYGIDPTLPLDLVYNPPGASLPRRQTDIERDFKRELDHRYGLRFTQLFAIANMPIGRFRTELERQNKHAGYMRTLVDGFNSDTLEGLMCRHQLHVNWDGTLYDCDFNSGIALRVTSDTPGNIRDFDPTTYLQRKICTGEHCFGCSAGWGSSFGGALV